MATWQTEHGQIDGKRKPEMGLNETKPICQTKQEKERGIYFWIVLLK